MRRYLFILALLCFAPLARAACSGSSPTWTAASASATDVQACFNETLTCGDTINIPSGSATWSTQVTLTPPTGCAANQGVTVVGATTCTGSACNPGSGGSGLNSAFTDNTNITLSDISGAFIIGPCSNTSFCDISDVTFINGNASSHGQIQAQGTHGQVSFRLHHIHFKDSTGDGGVAITANDGYGLIDHYLFNETAASNEVTPINVGGDFPSGGTLNWQDTTNFGSNQGIIVEDSYATTTNGGSTEGFYDGYYGGKITVRDSIINNMELGGCHGSDTAYWRSCVLQELYDLTISNCPSATSDGIMNNRGGGEVFWGNTVTGTCGSMPLQYYRIGAQGNNEGWGTASEGLNWSWTTVNGAGLAPLTLNASDWVALNSYTCSSSSPCIVGPTSNNTGAFNYESTANCVSGASRPSPFNQTYNATTSDGTCSWLNIGGTTTAGAGSAGWLSSAPDTTCTSGGSCTRYADNTNGTYPFRDQPGFCHNQVSCPIYAWSNSGAGLPSPLLSVAASNTSMITLNTDYFLNTAMPGYTAYTYPDPLQGAVSPTLNIQGVKMYGLSVR